jgi:hypothetical protein
MPEIRNVDDWWKVCDDEWDNLMEIIAHTMDIFSPAYDIPGNNKSTPTGKDINAELKHLKKTKDHDRLCRYFNAAWNLASEAYAAERVPGWLAMCDLCSEEWVFNENRP